MNLDKNTTIKRHYRPTAPLLRKGKDGKMRYKGHIVEQKLVWVYKRTGEVAFNN
jgi:hypothetical protein